MPRKLGFYEKIRLRTGGFKIKGKVIGGVHLDNQIKGMYRRGEVRIKVTRQGGLRVIPTTKGRKAATQRLKRIGR